MDSDEERNNPFCSVALALDWLSFWLFRNRHHTHTRTHILPPPTPVSKQGEVGDQTTFHPGYIARGFVRRARPSTAGTRRSEWKFDSVSLRHFSTYRCIKSYIPPIFQNDNNKGTARWVSRVLFGKEHQLRLPRTTRD
jgi:hypothetical protein